MQNKTIIHWSITCDTHTAPRIGTVRPFAGESWPHMARFLVQSAGNDWHLVAYSLDDNGDEVERYELDEDTDITVDNDPALWFRDPYAQKHHPLNEYVLIGSYYIDHAINGPELQNYVQPYAWPGGYTVFYLDRRDNVMCPTCVERNILSATDMNPQNSEAITSHGINYEDPAMFCDQCGERIKSAYAEDAA